MQLLGPQRRVFLVDDDAVFCRAMGKALGRKGYTVCELDGGKKAIAALSAEPNASDGPAVMVLDLQMPEPSGMEVLKRTPRRCCPVVVLTGHGTVPDVVEAMRLGAFSFLQKPLDADQLVPVLEQAMGGHSSQSGVMMVGQSPAMLQLRDVLERCAKASDPVLLLGETGTGKEVAARYLHDRSRRSQQPFVAINLACLPRDLVESELFGHVRGAFTGADRKKAGLFAEVGQGTLFLDEVSELPLDLQPKLLRVLETHQFRPVGETKEQPLQARLVCATNQDLRTLVATGRFREDLYYRLAVLPIELPPLRARPTDIVPIAEYWLKQVGLDATLDEEAKQALLAHDYPGNVRELVNVVRRLTLFSRSASASPDAETCQALDGALLQRMLAEDPFGGLRQQRHKRNPKTGTEDDPRATFAESGSSLVRSQSDLIGSAKNPVPLSLRELEMQHIERLLREHRNITTVAKLLQIDRRTLQRKLRGLGIEWRDE